MKFKQMGVKAGVADLHLPVPKGMYSGLYIEMKFGDGRLEDSQKRFLRTAAKYGNFCVVCYDAETATKIIDEYVRLQPVEVFNKYKMDTPNASIIKGGKVKPIPEAKN